MKYKITFNIVSQLLLSTTLYSEQWMIDVDEVNAKEESHVRLIETFPPAPVVVFDKKKINKSPKYQIKKEFIVKRELKEQVVNTGLVREYPYRKYIELHSGKSLDPLLVRAVIKQESNYRLKATSPKDARGLMQLIDGTAKRFGVKDSYNANDNIMGGTRYLKWLFKEFDNNLDYVLASYNAGEGAVRKYGGIPPYKETRNYVKKVKKNYERYKKQYNKTSKKTIHAYVVTKKEVKKVDVYKVDSKQRMKSPLSVFSSDF